MAKLTQLLIEKKEKIIKEVYRVDYPKSSRTEIKLNEPLGLYLEFSETDKLGLTIEIDNNGETIHTKLESHKEFSDTPRFGEINKASESDKLKTLVNKKIIGLLLSTTSGKPIDGEDFQFSDLKIHAIKILYEGGHFIFSNDGDEGLVSFSTGNKSTTEITNWINCW